MSSPIRAALAAVALAAFALASTASPVRADVAGAVRGTLIRSDRQPLANVTVTLAGNGRSLTAVTGPDGRFAFARVPFGTYALHATTPDGTADATVDVATGDGRRRHAARRARHRRRACHDDRRARRRRSSENTIGARELAALPANTSVNRVIETLPGIVRFSYDEPVAHGFHGITYELDGAPLPASTSSNFANLIDPRDVGSIEVFTGAFPAEFGGSRMGAVVNVAEPGRPKSAGTRHAAARRRRAGSNEAQLVKRFDVGRAQIALALDNVSHAARARHAVRDGRARRVLDATNQFLRVALPMGARDTLAFDVANQYATYQIPINTDPERPECRARSRCRRRTTSSASTTASRRSRTRTHARRQRLLPHRSVDALQPRRLRRRPRRRRARIRARHGDSAADVSRRGRQRLRLPVERPVPGPCRDLRRAALVGRVAHERPARVTYGIDLQQENFRSNVTIAFAPARIRTVRRDASSTHGAAGTADRARTSRTSGRSARRCAIKPGLRYDHSTGYVVGRTAQPALRDRRSRSRRHDRCTRTSGGCTRRRASRTRGATRSSRRPRRPARRCTTSSPNATPTSRSASRTTFGAGPPRVRQRVRPHGRQRARHDEPAEHAAVRRVQQRDRRRPRHRGPLRAVVGDDRRRRFVHVLALARRRRLGRHVSVRAAGRATDLTLQPEDHDQTCAGDVYVTRRFVRRSQDVRDAARRSTAPASRSRSTTAAAGCPRTSSVDAAVGRAPDGDATSATSSRVDNLLDHRYLIKVEQRLQHDAVERAAPRSCFRVIAPW